MPRRDDTFRWLALLILAFATVAFLLYARGVSHQHGQQVGAAGAGVGVAAVSVIAPAPGPGTAGDSA
jgi:hypothetical protein